MKTYNRPAKVGKACKPSVSHLEPVKAERLVNVHWLATKSRKAFTETLRG